MQNPIQLFMFGFLVGILFTSILSGYKYNEYEQQIDSIKQSCFIDSYVELMLKDKICAK